MQKKYQCLKKRGLLILIEKIPNAMKLSFLFMLISFMSFTAKAAAQKVSVTFNNVKMEKVLSVITKQTGLNVAYSKQVVNLDHRVSIQVEDAEVNHVLDLLVAETNMGYEVKNGKIYLYNKVRQPWKTQKYVAQVMHHLYFNAPAGLCGNEDCGQMSAWYVFSAMGFYPVNPVSGEYEIGTPLFPEMRMHLDNGKTFTVLAPAVNRENIYIRSVKLNGKPYDKSYITHQQIMDGATVEFEMSSEPGEIWYR